MKAKGARENKWLLAEEIAKGMDKKWRGGMGLMRMESTER